jgi:hypothetical protein
LHGVLLGDEMLDEEEVEATDEMGKLRHMSVNDSVLSDFFSFSVSVF